MSTLSDRIIAAVISLGGIITREQCQQLAREFGVRNINWLFGTRQPRMIRLTDGTRTVT